MGGLGAAQRVCIWMVLTCKGAQHSFVDGTGWESLGLSCEGSCSSL